jgi:3'-phosphoadenosine 5'-phosphosulfate sulfotransferase (PAPS reductase)/FAD synthetase
LKKISNTLQKKKALFGGMWNKESPRRLNYRIFEKGKTKEWN